MMPRSSFEWETFAISNGHEIQGFDKKANNNFQKHLLFTAALVGTDYEINRLNPLNLTASNDARKLATAHLGLSNRNAWCSCLKVYACLSWVGSHYSQNLPLPLRSK